LSLFKQKNEPLTTSTNNPISSIIGQDIVVTGNLTFNSKIQVDGKIIGDLNGDCLILSASGKIKGNIEAKSITCYGKIDGDLKVNKLFLKKNGVINGSVETSDLSVESGGFLNGEIKSRQQPIDLEVLQGSADSTPILEASDPQKSR
jgi:cytoskeletal protein CcmA (bactofilin family)